MTSRTYRRCAAIAATTGQRCRANSLPFETMCALHLPADDPRRVAVVDDARRRTQTYWRKWREARAAKAA